MIFLRTNNWKNATQQIYTIDMIDIQYIRDNAEQVAEKAKQKGYPVDVDAILKADSSHRLVLAKAEDLRSQRNANAAQMKGGKPAPDLVLEGKRIKTELATLESELDQHAQVLQVLLKKVPNMPLDEVPVGATEDENVVYKTVGEPTKFDFEPKNHAQIGELRGWIDKERATKVAGTRFTYLKGELVRLQFALVQWVMDTLSDPDVLQKIADGAGLQVSTKPFTPVLPPAIVKTSAYKATGRLNEEEVTYKLADTGEDEQWLNASAEHSLCNYYLGETLAEADLPQRFIGYSTSFRKEAGTYGKDMEGIIRLHQFDKLEMESFTTPESGPDEHKFMIAIQEYLVAQLGLSYRLLQKCTFDIGFPNASGWDVEVWVPTQNKYRETHSADFMADFQARGLQTRVKYQDGRTAYAHTNDATAFALGRLMAFLIENYQTADGHVRVPDVLKSYLQGKEEL